MPIKNLMGRHKRSGPSRLHFYGIPNPFTSAHYVKAPAGWASLSRAHRWRKSLARCRRSGGIRRQLGRSTPNRMPQGPRIVCRHSFGDHHCFGMEMVKEEAKGQFGHSLIGHSRPNTCFWPNLATPLAFAVSSALHALPPTAGWLLIMLRLLCFPSPSFSLISPQFPSPIWRERKAVKRSTGQPAIVQRIAANCHNFVSSGMDAINQQPVASQFPAAGAVAHSCVCHPCCAGSAGSAIGRCAGKQLNDAAHP